MNALLHTLYRFLLAWSKLDFLIGLSTGRAPHFIEADRAAIRHWEGELHKLEIQQ